MMLEHGDLVRAMNDRDHRRLVIVDAGRAA
jgi:hypothetical protein